MFIDLNLISLFAGVARDVLPNSFRVFVHRFSSARVVRRRTHAANTRAARGGGSLPPQRARAAQRQRASVPSRVTERMSATTGGAEQWLTTAEGAPRRAAARGRRRAATKARSRGDPAFRRCHAAASAGGASASPACAPGLSRAPPPRVPGQHALPRAAWPPLRRP